MHLLPRNKYASTIPALKRVSINNLFARSVVERHVRGKVFVDDITAPRSFYVVHPYGMSLLFGEIDDGFLKSGLKDYLLGNDGLRETSEFLQVFPTSLEEKIDDVLALNMSGADGNKVSASSSRPVVKHRRINFKFIPERYAHLREKLDLAAYSFQSIDRDIFNSFHGSVVPKKFWDSASNFLDKGVGFSLIVDEWPTAVSFSSFVHDHMLELGMETDPEYRRAGLGTAVTAKIIDYCLEKNLEPIWACRDGNKSSYNLAVKLGFEAVAYLPYYEFIGRQSADSACRRLPGVGDPARRYQEHT